MAKKALKIKELISIKKIFFLCMILFFKSYYKKKAISIIFDRYGFFQKI
jgi:hypothetical protein